MKSGVVISAAAISPGLARSARLALTPAPSRPPAGRSFHILPLLPLLLPPIIAALQALRALGAETNEIAPFHPIGCLRQWRAELDDAALLRRERPPPRDPSLPTLHFPLPRLTPTLPLCPSPFLPISVLSLIPTLSSLFLKFDFSVASSVAPSLTHSPSTSLPL